MKATFPDGTIFESTPDEYLAIRTHPNTPNRHTVPTTGTVPSAWNEKKVRQFWDSLDAWHGGGRQQKLIKFLMNNGGKATENEVWEHLGIEKGQQLAGVLANITRNA